MSRRRDAALALAVLVPVVGAVGVLDAPVDPVAVGVGATGALSLELLLARRRATVRRVWARPAVQTGAVAAALVGAFLLTRHLGPWVLSAMAGGLVAYLLFLGALAARDRL